MASPRKEREAQFLGSEAMPSSFPWQLTQGANTLLTCALHDRRRCVFKTATNHYTDHAPGALALVLTAFDAWVSQTLALSTWHGGENLRAPAAQLGISAKYERLVQASAATIPPDVASHLALLVEVRHEIIHHLPRPVSSEGNVPAWLVELHRRDLFIASGHTSDFPFPTKLGSYKLAYWAFRTVEAAVAAWVDSASPAWEWQFRTAANFLIYAHESCSPEELPAFDARYGIELTVHEPSSS